MGRCIHVAGTIVSMESKHATHDQAPLDGFVCHLESEKRLQFERVIALLLGRIVFKVVLIWLFKLFDVLPPELVNLGHLLRVSFGPLVEIVWQFILSLGDSFCS